MRIALAGLAHEANSFSPHAAGWDDFRGRRLLHGPDMLANWEDAHTELAGAMGVLAAERDVEVVPLLHASALSSAPVQGPVFRALLGELIVRLERALPVDGVLLILHGAMMAEGAPDATGATLSQVRTLLGPKLPVVGTLDLHANVTQRMAAHATALVGYRTAPHVDMFETGETAARLLLRTVRGEITPRMAVTRVPMLLPPENETHNWPPLSEVIDQALALERDGMALHAAVYPVQPWLDAPDVASSVLVVTDDDASGARRYADELARAFWARREQFVAPTVSPDEAVAQAMARSGGTVVLCDSADGTTSGSTGDSTAILQAVLAHGPSDEIALLNLVDPQAMAEASAAGVGAEVTLSVGGKLAPAYFQPVTIRARVRVISDGVFRFKGPGLRGVEHHMGRAVVLVSDGIHLVTMERAVSQWDPQLYRSLGEEPRDARIVQVKSPMAFRAAYADIADEVLIVRAPGAASPDLRALPWRHLPRPIYPLDEDLVWP
jgi:microcystin degradation protein MlrC